MAEDRTALLNAILFAAEEMGYDWDDLRSGRKNEFLVRVRYTCYHVVSRRCPDMDKCRIAGFLGIRTDHSTVLHGIAQADWRLVHEERYARFYAKFVGHMERYAEKHRFEI